jgi:hypothetical protein
MFRLMALFIAVLIQSASSTTLHAASCSVSAQVYEALAKRVEQMSKPCANAMNAGLSPTRMCAVCKPYAAQASKFERLAWNKNCFASASEARSNKPQLAHLRQIVKFSRRYCGG